MADKAAKKTVEQDKARILRAATKRVPLTGRELGVKMNDKYPGCGYLDSRTFGVALGQLVRDGKLVKSGALSRPKYAKAE